MYSICSQSVIWRSWRLKDAIGKDETLIGKLLLNVKCLKLLHRISSGCPQNVKAQHEDILDKLLTQALLPQGGWQRRVVEKLQGVTGGFVFALTKHSSSSTEDWGARLYKKAKEIMNL